MNRLFVAVPVSFEIKDYIFDQVTTLIGDNRYKWESKDKMHITIKFLGDTETSKIKEIDELLNTSVSDFSKFSLELNKIGFFYKDKEPKVLWYNFKDSDMLNKINSGLEDRFANIGFPKENKKFKPHITLLRIKPGVFKEELKELENIKIENKVFEVNKIELIKSELKPSGSFYTKLNEYKLN